MLVVLALETPGRTAGGAEQRAQTLAKVLAKARRRRPRRALVHAAWAWMPAVYAWNDLREASRARAAGCGSAGKRVEKFVRAAGAQLSAGPVIVRQVGDLEAGRWELFTLVAEDGCGGNTTAAAAAAAATVARGGAMGPQRAQMALVCVGVRGLGGTDRITRGVLWWDALIAGLLNLRVGLVTANAFISTLGGGHFLCKQIDASEAMARRQLGVATQLGDPGLAAQCRIHLAYNSMQRGQLGAARQRLRVEWAVAHVLRDGHLKSMVRAAWHRLRILRRLRHELAKPTQDAVRDEFYRHRFVQSS